MIKIRNICAICLVVFCCCGCSTPKQISYFQDVENGESVPLSEMYRLTFREGDRISIVVNSKDPLLADLFNLPVVSHRIGTADSSLKSGNLGVSCYTVDSQGNIDFPVLGALPVVGMSREALAADVKSRLVAANLVKDPVVTVEYVNLGVSVLGEVARPGRVVFERDRMTLPEALSQAGDLTIYGNRCNVLVVREADGKRTAYRVDLTSGSDLYASPAYVLCQNDVIYVEPNVVRARQSTVNGNNVRSTSFWFSLASLLMSAAVLIFK